VCGPRRRWQEDAHEFLIQLLDAMHTTEVNEAGGVTKLDDVTQVRHAAGCSLPKAQSTRFRRTRRSLT
jgi:ubiquitin C-terminal hydrolase